MMHLSNNNRFFSLKCTKEIIVGVWRVKCSFRAGKGPGMLA